MSAAPSLDVIQPRRRARRFHSQAEREAHQSEVSEQVVLIIKSCLSAWRLSKPQSDVAATAQSGPKGRF